MAGCAGIRWVVRLTHGRGAGVGRWMRLLADWGAVPANHRARESLFYAPLGHIGPRGGLNLSSPSALLKVNYLVMRYLHFESVRGDLQEGNGCASRCQLPLFSVPITVFSSTKSGFLCAFAFWNPRFHAFRAQNRHFCALLGSGSPVFGLFEHKIEVFVRFWGPEPSISGFSSTKSGFLCAFRLRIPRFQAF